MKDLHSRTIQLAHDVPEIRKFLVPLLRKTAAPEGFRPIPDDPFGAFKSETSSGWEAW